MRTRAFVLALFSAATLSATTIRADIATPALEKELLAAMSAVADAVAKRDAAALQRLLHDELTYSHSDGRLQTKADVVGEAKAGRGAGNVNILDATVHVYGNTAIVRGRAGTPPKPVQGNSPFATAVFIKGPQGWQLVARTATRPAEPAASRPPAH
jgi:ketosteroid isomerase-like protein